MAFEEPRLATGRLLSVTSDSGGARGQDRLGVDLTLTDAWTLWWSGQRLTDHTLYGLSVLWLGRTGKLMAFLARPAFAPRHRYLLAPADDAPRPCRLAARDAR